MVFTGIVQRIGVAHFDKNTSKLYVTVDETFWSKSQTGDSVAINGVCLTLLNAPTGPTAEFFVMEETLSKTNLGELSLEDSLKYVNVEHALRVGDSLGGHTVTGHVDGVATITSIVYRNDGSKDLWVDLSSFKSNMIYIVHKGSICLDGVSLTVAEIKDTQFRVSLIPHTQKATNFQYRRVGDKVNVEFDQQLKLLASSNSLKSRATSEWDRRLADEEFMQEAIKLGHSTRFTAAPNPWVGCIIVNNGKIIGRGAHKRAGEPHAERLAINDAIQNGFESLLENSTCYVTLEPCHHFGRTPPCDALLIEKKISRVVVALTDPDTRVSGRGIENLRSHGIQVDVGMCEELARESLAPYLKHRSTGLPFVVAKVALSIDGKIACGDGTSQWITSQSSRQDAQLIRAASQAIIVGSKTALVDKPRLTVRLPDIEILHQPLRVVLDSKGQVREGPLLDTSAAKTIIYTTAACNADTKELWHSKGVESVEVESTPDGHVALRPVLEDLGKRGVLQVMVEGGSELHSSFLKQGLVDRLVVYQGPCLIGSSGQAWLQEVLADTIRSVRFWQLADVRRIGNDIRAEYILDNPNANVN